MERSINQTNLGLKDDLKRPIDIFGTGNYQIFYSSGTFTTPTNVGAIRVSVWGSGGSGAQGNSTSHRATGGGGGFSRKVIVSPSASYVVTVGTGGTAQFNPMSSGNAGGTSSFGSVS